MLLLIITNDRLTILLICFFAIKKIAYLKNLKNYKNYFKKDMLKLKKCCFNEKSILLKTLIN